MEAAGWAVADAGKGTESSSMRSRCHSRSAPYMSAWATAAPSGAPTAVISSPAPPAVSSPLLTLPQEADCIAQYRKNASSAGTRAVDEGMAEVTHRSSGQPVVPHRCRGPCAELGVE